MDLISFLSVMFQTNSLALKMDHISHSWLSLLVIKCNCLENNTFVLHNRASYHKSSLTEVGIVFRTPRGI